MGGTTGLIGALASKTLGIDSSDFWLDEARAAYPDIRFEQVFAWWCLCGPADLQRLEWRLRSCKVLRGVSMPQCDCFDIAKIQSFGLQFSKIFIDISGSRDLKILFPLIECYMQTLKPQVRGRDGEARGRQGAFHVATTGVVV